MICPTIVDPGLRPAERQQIRKSNPFKLSILTKRTRRFHRYERGVRGTWRDSHRWADLSAHSRICLVSIETDRWSVLKYFTPNLQYQPATAHYFLSFFLLLGNIYCTLGNRRRFYSSVARAPYSPITQIGGKAKVRPIRPKWSRVRNARRVFPAQHKISPELRLHFFLLRAPLLWGLSISDLHLCSLR